MRCFDPSGKWLMPRTHILINSGEGAMAATSYERSTRRIPQRTCSPSRLCACVANSAGPKPGIAPRSVPGRSPSHNSSEVEGTTRKKLARGPVGSSSCSRPPQATWTAAESGRVGNSVFSGTVAQSPNDQERLANMEKRLAQLEEPAKGDIVDIHKQLQDFDGRLRQLEGSKTMEQRVDDLERKITQLENQKPGLDWRKIKYNREGFHFHGSIGPNMLEPSLNKVEENLSDVEKGPTPEEVVEPVATRLSDIEERINEVADEIRPKDKMAQMEKRLVALEKQAQDDDEKE